MPDEPINPSADGTTADEPSRSAAAPRGARDQSAADEEQEGRGFKVTDRRFWTLDEEELAAEAQSQKAPSYIARLEAQLAEKDRQLREYIAAYKKEVVEELEQTKRRLTADAAQQRKQIVAQVAEPMLDVFEALERSILAARSAQGEQTVDALLQGVKMVQMLMAQKLKEVGLERIETVGLPFDPALHEAVAVAAVNDPAQDNTVVAEFSSGFAFDGRVFRPARVQVGKLQS